MIQEMSFFIVACQDRVMTTEGFARFAIQLPTWLSPGTKPKVSASVPIDQEVPAEMISLRLASALVSEFIGAMNLLKTTR